MNRTIRSWLLPAMAVAFASGLWGCSSSGSDAAPDVQPVDLQPTDLTVDTGPRVDILPQPDILPDTADTQAPADLKPTDQPLPPTDTVADLTPPADLPATPDAEVSGDGQTDQTPDVEPLQPPPRPQEYFVEPQGALRAGVGTGFVTGPVGAPMAGYGFRIDGKPSPWADLFKGSEGFYHYMKVKAMVLEVEGERLVLLKIPMMCSEHSLTEGTAQKLIDRYGIDLRGRIITGAGHSHHSIGRYWRIPRMISIAGVDSPDEELIDRLSSAFADAIQQAIGNLDAAQWAYAFRDDWDPQNRVYSDRRGENDPTYGKDPRLWLFAVRRPDGTPLATIMNFGLHGTAFGVSNDLLTEDAPGAIEMKFEEYFYAQEHRPIHAMFMQSAGGDVSPRGDSLDHPTPARLELLGETAAPMIYDLYQTLQWQDQADLAVRSRRIDLRYHWMGYDDFPEFLNKNGTPYLWGGLNCKGQDVEAGQSSQGVPKDCDDLKNLLEYAGSSVPNGEIHQVYLSTARVGPIFFVTLPGEPTYSVVKYLREQMALRSTEQRPINVIAMGYSQDHYLYLTMPDDWFMGGYEAEMSVWGPLAGKYITDRQLELVDDLLADFNRPVFYEESAGLSPALPFTPRAYERSLEPGTVTLEVLPHYERTGQVEFGWRGGDPSVESLPQYLAPQIIMSRWQSPDSWVAVASPSGQLGQVYDNSRYYMITFYEPDPPPGKLVLAERNHNWRVVWQVPTDWPAGTYRLTVRGAYWDGSAAHDYEIASQPFEIAQSSAAEAAALLTDGLLTLHVTLPPVAYTGVEGLDGDHRPLTGWRLLDPTVGPNDPVTVRAPLQLAFSVDGVWQDQTFEALFDPAVGMHTFDFSATGLPSTGFALRVRAYQTSDIEPSPLEADIVQ